MMRSDTYLNRDRALHADMLAAVAEGRAQVRIDGENALLLRERTGVCFLAAANEEAAKICLGLLSRDDTVVLHGDAARGAAEKLGYEIDPPCTQWVYEGPPLPVDGLLEIRHPDERDFPLVEANYGLYGGEHLRRDFEKPEFLGGYLDGKMVGFIGLHGEGSIGLLDIFPEYRRRGFAERLMCAIINNRLAAGKLPYCQVYADNTGSAALQQKLGLIPSAQYVRWAWFPDR